MKEKEHCGRCGRRIEEAAVDVMRITYPFGTYPVCQDCFRAFWEAINEGRKQLEDEQRSD